MGLLDVHPHPWSEGDRVRVNDKGPEHLRGMTGTVTAAGGMCLGTLYDFNTGVDLDGWDKSHGEPILNDQMLDRLES